MTTLRLLASTLFSAVSKDTPPARNIFATHGSWAGRQVWGLQVGAASGLEHAGARKFSESPMASNQEELPPGIAKGDPPEIPDNPAAADSASGQAKTKEGYQGAMHHSYGQAYHGRSSDEGFGERYGNPVDETGVGTIGNAPPGWSEDKPGVKKEDPGTTDFDFTQGSEVAEKEHARHSKIADR